ncbi:hypothetical protein EST35_0088 [Pseudomonas phage vB_PaeM_PA5oct]|uniref:Uncharacterized protein n=1 Tax=Pseudomonas phage vB_PaeM_PA5oct TaxID=2163605 RepID=A0A4Y5JU32_9CAUD|nr:hypothetical protein PQE65_gp395 [Pseudomonas phage vB_PaeM_PA5oct]QCG75970.1 hypothetical protein EST35_0088 [Pseudomonas phage vB_PaeM_PA5oct]
MNLVHLWINGRVVTARKVVSKHTVRNPNSPIDIETIDVVRLRLPRGVRASSWALRKAVYQLMEQSCSCSRDCCGHWFGGARKIYINGRDISVVAGYQRNY